MKNVLLLATLFSVSSSIFAQVTVEYRDNHLDYYTWFHERSNTVDLYQPGKVIYTFVDHAPIRREACIESDIVAELPIAAPVTNLFDESAPIVWETVNGYNDIWHHVKGFDKNGHPFVGYIWGGHLAKAYQPAYITGDGLEEFVLLGVSSNQRKGLHDLNAALKVVSDHKIIAKAIIPDMCLFEECTSDALVRVITDQPFKGEIIIEASSMTISCAMGIEKNYFSWQGGALHHIYHSSRPENIVSTNKSFQYEQNGETILCRFSHEKADFTPVWSCKRIKKGVNPRA